ncbi:flowering time control protein FCA-like [Capsicum annuum]
MPITISNHNVNSATTMQETGELAAPLVVPEANYVVDPVETIQSDWIEHTSRKEKKYYYNRRTRISTWEKPRELMTEMEVRSRVIEIFMGSLIQFPVLINEKRSTQFFFYEAS